MDFKLWEYIFEMFNYKIRQKKNSKLQTLTPPLNFILGVNLNENCHDFTSLIIITIFVWILGLHIQVPGDNEGSLDNSGCSWPGTVGTRGIRYHLGFLPLHKVKTRLR